MPIKHQLVLPFVAALFFASCSHRIHTEITIPAEPAQVWQVLMEPEDYPKWHPIIKKLEGPIELGKTIKIHAQLPDQEKPSVINSEVRQLTENQLFLHGGGLPLLFTFEHRFTLEKVAGGTRFVQGEVFTGMAVTFTDLSPVEDSYKQANKNLKELFEKRRTTEESPGE